MTRSPPALLVSLAFSIALAAASVPSCAGGATSSSGVGGSSSHGTASSSHGSGGGDAGTDGGTDGATDAAAGIVCSALLSCEEACTSTSCTSACYAEATGVAQGLFNALSSCLADACPDGGSLCEETAAMGGCVVDFSICIADTSRGPADPDGGGVVTPDSGQPYTCSELDACILACPSGGAGCIAQCSEYATNTAVSLENALNACLAMACPSMPSDPCATPGSTCSACIQQAELGDTGPCATAYNACTADGSDGGP